MSTGMIVFTIYGCISFVLFWICILTYFCDLTDIKLNKLFAISFFWPIIGVYMAIGGLFEIMNEKSIK